MKKTLYLLTIVLLLVSCVNRNKKQENRTEMRLEKYQKGTFGYDLNFLGSKQSVVVLEDKSGNAQVLISPDYQGRVMTSTAQGLSGKSFGWMNYDLIASGKVLQHINGFGGEDRFWLGPEGGQFSIFFKKGVSFDFENWFTPKEIDTEPFKLVSKDDTKALFERKMSLTNYSGFKFDLTVNREVKLLSNSEIHEIFNTKFVSKLNVLEGVNVVAFQTNNKITNTGNKEWNKESGMLSIWILGMLNPSPTTTIVVPFQKGDAKKLGKIVTDDYFGKVPADRLKVTDEIIYFRGDGEYRSKIGVAPKRAKSFAGSYDEENKVLTIVNYTLPEGKTDYVNSLWKLQEHPFAGDAVNSYNDGALEDGSQIGPFYELESSSPAANLKPNQSILHTHTTMHFQGKEAYLNEIAKKVLGADLETIKTILK